MKIIEYSDEKREKILNDRWINLNRIAYIIKDWDFIWIIQVPSRPNQKMFVLLYDGYVCCVPYVEDIDKIFLKTAYLSRKMNKILNNK